MFPYLVTVLAVALPLGFVAWITWFALRRESRFEAAQREALARGERLAAWVYDREHWELMQRLNRLPLLREALLHLAVGAALAALFWLGDRTTNYLLFWLLIPVPGMAAGIVKAISQNGQFGRFPEGRAEVQIGTGGFLIRGRFKPFSLLQRAAFVQREGRPCLHLSFAGYRYAEDVWLPLPAEVAPNGAWLAQQLNERK